MVQLVLGKYEIRATIATGPMSTVYDGWDTIIERRVAIKAVPLAQTAHSEELQHLTRFKREAQAAGRLQHPAVVGIFDYGESADFAFIVMEFVDGGTLKSALEDGKRFSMVKIDLLMQDILAGLQYSHDRGVTHRDIKPANIMLTRNGRAKIADFGIARIENSDITQIGTVMGTPSYMSPEQFRGEAIGASTDIYSAGVILYQLLTGERPFDGGLATIMHKALNTVPRKPSSISVTVPHAADAVVARAMARAPQDRFANATQFAQALHAALALRPVKPATPLLGALSARVLGHASGRGVTTPANRHLIAGALLAVLVAGAGTTAYRMLTARAGQRPREAPQAQASSSPAPTTGATAAAPRPASRVDGAPPPAALYPASVDAGLQAISRDLTPALSAAPGQAPEPPPVFPMAPTLSDPQPPAPQPPARPLAPGLLTPLGPQYPAQFGTPNPFSIAPKPPPVVHAAPHALPLRPNSRQQAESKTDSTLPLPPNPLGGPRAKKPTRDIEPGSEQTDTASRDAPAVSPPVAPKPEAGAPPKRIYGRFNVIDGRRVLVPATEPDP